MLIRKRWCIIERARLVVFPAPGFMPSLGHCVQASWINKLKAVQVSEDQIHTSGFKFMFFYVWVTCR